ncbi:hypothetical protein N0V91_006507 [Didymella pomorum]|uniref:Uncharacterized protein n=1 Tax=Didymella pomorum TaxID=749634 RepID=A0A9W9D7C5_9PLEO|nr:hypothetical protein N0V91_006507 [Didymella pomorum]
MIFLWYDLTDLSTGLPPQYNNLSIKPVTAPVVKGGALWPDHVNNLFYSFGDEYESRTFTKSFDNLWLYDTIYNTWNESNPDATQTGMLWPAHGASAVSDDGVAYYYDGWLNENTISGWQGHPLMLRGLLSFDMTSFKWTNRTFDDDTPRAEGSLNNLPVSDRGMLVYMGGIETTSSGAVMQTWE